MVDPLPEGCILLVDAWNKFHRKLWNGYDPCSELSPYADVNNEVIYGELPPEMAKRHQEGYQKICNLQWQEMIDPLSNGFLQALVYNPKSLSIDNIPCSYWPDILFPELLFVEEEILRGPNDKLYEFRGRIPFLKQVQFDEWLTDYFSPTNQLTRENAPVNIAIREYLSGVARDGLASSAKLEDAMARWDLPPLASNPDHADFDPMALAVWTLPMSVAWIVWRTSDSVRNQWDEFRFECWDWHSFIRRNHSQDEKSWTNVSCEELVVREPASLSILMMMEASSDASDTEDERSKILSVKTAREALWRNLMEGTLTATGIDPNDQIVEIPACEWAYLELSGNLNGSDHLVNQHQPLQSAYTDLTFRRESIADVWKGDTRSSIGRLNSPRTVAGETKCRNRLIELMCASPESNPSKKVLFSLKHNPDLISPKGHSINAGRMLL